MSAEVLARARACLGVRFVPQGRDPATGLDCVGLAAVALGRTDVPRDAAMRTDAAAAMAAIDTLGLRRVAAAGAGDLLLLQVGPGQAHLGIATGDGIVHADARARRVVERPGAVPWPIVAAWRGE